MTLRPTLLLVLGAVGLGVLAWRIDVGVVRAAALQLGWGMALIVGQEIVAHVFNALAWRFAFAPGDARAFPLRELVRLRVAGDAVNYLTPTATLGGEVARAAMLRGGRDAGVRAVSVIVAKSTQTLAQALFMTAGLILVASAWVPPAILRSPRPWAVLAVVTALGALGLLGVRSRWRAGASRLWQRALGPRVLEFVRQYPQRTALSTGMFGLGYAWGAFEAYWICRFLGLQVPIATAMAIEVLSITADGLLFMVPAKIGTQEGGKVAVFAALGLPVALGFAFGIARHVRELVWAALGVLLCYAAGGRDGALFRRPALDSPGRPTAL
jgi:glycosyltransferase 2 family protein